MTEVSAPELTIPIEVMEKSYLKFDGVYNDRYDEFDGIMLFDLSRNFDEAGKMSLAEVATQVHCFLQYRVPARRQFWGLSSIGKFCGADLERLL